MTEKILHIRINKIIHFYEGLIFYLQLIDGMF